MDKKMFIGHEVRVLDNMLKRQFETYEREKGKDELTIMHGRIIGYLYKNQQSDIFQRDIETVFSITRSTVTCILKRMEQKGYVKREGVIEDARLKKITLTEKGRQVHEEIIQDIEYLEKKVTEGISEEELTAFFLVLKKLKNNISKGDPEKAAVYGLKRNSQDEKRK